ncbi:sugar transporter ERD6-like 5 isoform X1 [Lycium barbarum]|uniref:sugar transporter ERD6-like 5 isoform X1 n=2 Tax=Lycium barbarum TaxID=112863 RepID=UPI00293EFAF3|nr:sugar transporter ERD6-like 5 isoform X1 [Lycium barbarum]XP_060217982.1 sugar transporter ERD6-like 5 isoform X1 [Lycium barbarum]XP_060217983.1 sugar transporter ERD6-like 5 isoform X1 [Lycium barbarum]XP_060217984.1 sugar transporter ERD6-like 5 isoform X1 [Lycium barbarum]XP_060217985.1 sugar transporter ERD6-like 5 isoform X1 [Lycium barbarum]XP_060217986.1 sugar transporter ERD6-like 5 isoform X1 [Lycium barbarum]
MEEQLLSTKGNKFPVGTSATVFLSTFVVTCGSLSYGFAVGYSSPAQSGIMADLGLSIADYSTFGAILTLGGTVGALASGTIADMFGRRVAMWFLDLCSILGWLSIIFATSVWWLDIGRFLMGIGAGALFYVAPIYIAEISPKSIRGGCTAAFAFMVYFGFSVMFLIGNILTWRTLAIVGIIPSLVQFLGLFFIPESPRWLAKIGRDKQVEASLQYLRGRNVDISLETAEIKDNVESLQQLSGSRYLDMFNRRYAHSLIVGFGVMILVQSGGTDAISSFASSIFEKAGCSASFATTTMGLIQLPFAAMGIFLLDATGRRPVLMVASAGTCFGNFLVGVGFLCKEYDQMSQFAATLVETGILVFSVFYSMGVGGAAITIVSEIFPMNIKGSAGSLAIVCNWFTSWIVTYAFNFLFEWSPSGVFFMFTCFSGLMIPFVAKIVPETKGRTLEEIQASMTLLN